jgi:hypothetical protein
MVGKMPPEVNKRSVSLPSPRAREEPYGAGLNIKLAGVVFASSFAVYFLAVYLLKKQASSSLSLMLLAVSLQEGYSGGMAASAKPESEGSPVGLCADCEYARRIESARGSIFYLCRRSLTDPAFPQYPRLPVIQCSGYLRKG